MWDKFGTLRQGVRHLPLAMVAVSLFSCKTTAPSDAGTKSADRPGDQITRIDVDPKTGQALQNSTHFRGPMTVAGRFALNPDSIKTRYKNLEANAYGTTTLKMGPDYLRTADGKVKMIRDLQYPLGNGKVGLRPFPAIEPDTVGQPSATEPYVNRDMFKTNAAKYEGELKKVDIRVARVGADGKVVALAGVPPAKETRLNALDDYLMNHAVPGDTKLTNFWEIFAVTTYTHPQDHAQDFKDLGGSDKMQGGFSHMGAYFGRGRTRNSPFGYEQWKIWAGSPGSAETEYPVHVVEVRLNGVPRAKTNVNARQITTLLNGGTGRMVNFPRGGYEFDWLMLDSLAGNLDFFAAWLDKDYPAIEPNTKKKWTEVLDQVEFATYCAEHITASLNVAFNLPFNKLAFKKAYANAIPGKPDYGSTLFDKAVARHKELTGYAPDTIDFKPLYELQFGQTADPMKLREANQGLVWKLQSTVDFMSNMTEQYASWPDVGVTTTTALLFGMQPEAEKRIKITKEEFFGKYTLPLVEEMFVHEASTKVSRSSALAVYKAQVQGQIAALFGATDAAKQVQQIADKALARPEVAQYAANAVPVASWDAWKKFKDSPKVKAAVSSARSRKLSCTGADKCVKWYSSPAILQRIMLGLHDANPLVHMETVGTLFDPIDLFALQGATVDSSYDVAIKAP